MAARHVRARRAATARPAPDLAILITIVLQGNAVLVGPPPARLLDPVPHDDLIRGAIAGIPHLLSDLESDTRNVLLSFARIWSTLETGQIPPKDAAAAWALAQLPPEHQPPLARARDMYVQGEDETRWADLPAVRAHIVYGVSAIRQYSVVITGDNSPMITRREVFEMSSQRSGSPPRLTRWCAGSGSGTSGMLAGCPPPLPMPARLR